MKCYICGVDINKASMDNLSPICGCPICEVCAEDMTKHDWEVLRKEFEDDSDDEDG